ncbi:MAG: PLP-dependent transferase [Planctomycetota bacterium]
MAAIDAVLALCLRGTLLVGRDLYGGTLRLAAELAYEREARVVDVDASDSAALARRPSVASARTGFLVESPTRCRRCATCARRRAPAATSTRDSPSTTLMLRLSAGGSCSRSAPTPSCSPRRSTSADTPITAGAVIVRDRRSARSSRAAPNAAAPRSHRSRPGCARAASTRRRLERPGGGDERSNSRAPSPARHEVTAVHHASLDGAPGRDVLADQARGAGSVVAVELAAGLDPVRFAESLELFSISVSFGSVRSTVCLPRHTSHASVPRGLSPTVRPPSERLVRLSIGLEDPSDLRADLGRALESLRVGDEHLSCAAARGRGTNDPCVR